MDGWGSGDPGPGQAAGLGVGSGRAGGLHGDTAPGSQEAGGKERREQSGGDSNCVFLDKIRMWPPSSQGGPPAGGLLNPRARAPASECVPPSVPSASAGPGPAASSLHSSRCTGPTPRNPGETTGGAGQAGYQPPHSRGLEAAGQSMGSPQPGRELPPCPPSGASKASSLPCLVALLFRILGQSPAWRPKAEP